MRGDIDVDVLDGIVNSQLLRLFHDFSFLAKHLTVSPKAGDSR